ncbi:ROK family protein [Microbacterium sp. STN6]|uniref:ROK family protein n=1 Tax=Microbacterium sp. STN6 TaxID=2995588 RepID=UPI002260840C|nr:ROK family protein [Microbacterium sp. STN6]MCX7523337.1 ROK family protein [Microbacterium sp. STN6]
MRLGIDIGGTKTDAVAVLDDGTTSTRIRLATGFGPEAVTASAIASIVQVCELTGTDAAALESIGIGIPGFVEGGSLVHHAVNLGVESLDLGGAVSRRFGVATVVENDVKAAALGAYHVLGLEGSMAYLNLGTGLAAGLVVNGRLWRGAYGTAGEIGHIPIDPAGVLCACGQHGCLETVASGSGVARLWRTDDEHPARALMAAALARDEEALIVARRLFEGIASAVRVLVLTVDVDTVVIGGGLSHLGDALVAGVSGVLAEWASSSAFLASLHLADRLRLIPEGVPVAAIGAGLVGTVEEGVTVG